MHFLVKADYIVQNVATMVPFASVVEELLIGPGSAIVAQLEAAR